MERPKPTRAIQLGDTVELLKLGTKASVIAIQKDGTYTLQAGILKMTVKPEEVYLLEDANQFQVKKERPAHSGREMRTAAMSSEIDLRGMDAIEATCVLDRFLDEIFKKCDVKISIKTRIGKDDPEEFARLLDIYNQYPVEELIIHPRVREDFYSGTPRLDAFSRAYEVRKAPLCYNGDIFTVEDLKRIEREFPQITAVMIGRGVLRHPGLTGQLHGKDLPEKSVWEAFAGQLRDEYVRISINEEKALFKLKEIWSYLRWSFPESNIWDRQMKVAGDLETFFYGMRNLLDTYDPEKIPEKRGIPGLHNS